MSALSSVLSDWDRILGSLLVPFHKINSIRSENSSDYMRMAAGLHTWISTRCSSPTWQGLIKALMENDQIEAVLKVEQRMRAKYNDYIAQ